MTAQGSLVANRGRRFKWAIELSGPGGGSRSRSDRGGGQGDSLYPVGYLDKQVPDTSVQETDRILVEKRCWDIALGPLKQIPMNLFIMYMAGNTISIFPTMMVCMMAWRPIQALMAISAKDGVQWWRTASVNLRKKYLVPLYQDPIYNLFMSSGSSFTYLLFT
ncbi:ER membrane protein complex subunit 4 isoform X2 [Prionailurus viverrinus]|uniref:ER membrane protein complex subunit 4 n=3 Tax=Felinae TaxID=338152 RepID=A0A6I9ZLM9_ACIJB|nr:ER membrane protein complex subunit 4 isoform X3 [Acinonyx jubatus]XP_025774394.1 ER membrane protein complex subunit 4 isoform X2 [Puma concolor]XP_040348137.1 ER membrane protein complex subunit 4 isoform X3 [Puma yagouaroundi]XP_043411672.1 ER membrane protein complex subunit 4 isoform X3 [Prionailurus bengalensis]XP_045306109.1 ER membrane protein complex subunit 4 isoform X3 [Leopardus geoffroyi]XP_046931320.1 ER membrane protein complex subunit 4 isoform X3 [Lynx rufus]XP_047718199.1